MQKVIPRLLAGLAIILNLSALANFLVWFGQTDFMFGHFKGPPERVIAALILSIPGAITTMAWLAALFFSPRPPTRPRPSVRRLLGGLAVLAIAAPSLIIIPVGVDEWDGALAERRRTAAARIPTDDPAGVERLLLALNDEDYGVRHRAAYSLTTAPTVPASAIPILTEVAARREELTSFYVVQTLARLGPEASAAIPVLIDLLDAGELLGPAAGQALGKIGERSLPALLTASHSSDAQVRESVAQAFGVFTPPTEETIPRLAAMLGDSNARVRTVAAWSLGGHGVAAQSALPELDKALHDPDPDARAAAEQAVAKIGKATLDSLDHYTRELLHSDRDVRAIAAARLSEKGVAASPALPALHKAMNDPEPVVRLSASRAVWLISGDAAQVIPTLVELLTFGAGRDYVGLNTMDFLCEMGHAADGTLPTLEELATDDNDTIRRSASKTIQCIVNPPE